MHQTALEDNDQMHRLLPPLLLLLLLLLSRGVLLHTANLELEVV